MEVSNFASFCLFAVISAFTPGPNNMMLAASAATFGFRATWPHILGITVGFNLMVVAGLLGLNELFSAFPLIYNTARYAAFCFLLYLCWKIATATAPQTVSDESARITTASQPIGFWSAAIFQMINPKAVIVIVSAITAYTDVSDSLSITHIAIAGVFVFVTITSTALWSYAGSMIGRLLENQRQLRLFNIIMAGLLLAALAPVILASMKLF
jgi:threonine/homoserine/homoserine lactone efflux protein